MKRCIAAVVAICLMWQGCLAAIEKDGVKVANPNLELPVVELPSMERGTVVLEAEDGTLSADATIIGDSAASGGMAVKTINATMANSADEVGEPTITLPFTIGDAGEYQVWARLKTPTNGNDSIYLSYNGGSYSTLWLTAQSSYYWTQLPAMSTVGGQLKIEFKYREAGTILDKLVVTADTEYNPIEMNDMPSQVDTDGLLYPEPPFTPPEGHPRLFVNDETIAQIKVNVQSDLLKGTYETVKNYASETLNCNLPDNGESGNYDETTLLRIQSRALMYLLGEVDDNHGRQTIAYMREYIGSVKFPNVQDITRSMGNVMTTGAMVYDWCYDLLTDDDKSFFIRRFKEIAAEKEIGYPPTVGSSIGSHSGEGEIMRDLISAGIVCYDEDPQMYNLAAGRFFSEYIESRKLFNKAGAHPNGSAYGPYRLGWEYWASIIFNRMGLTDVLGSEIGDVPLLWIYDRLPTGMIMKDGDVYDWGTNRYFTYSVNPYLAYLFGGNEYDNPYVRGEWIKENSLNNYATEPIWSLLFVQPDKEWSYPDDLPLAYATTYPLTSLTARTSWQNGLSSPAAIVKMKAYERNLEDHMHKDVGSFQIYYKGSLALDSGNYAVGYGTAHDYNYAKRTVAHNLVTVYDPEESTWLGGDYANDGGQINRTTVVVPTYEEMMSDENQRAETKGVYIGPNEYTPEFSYLKTDLTKAYTDKVSDYKRSMVFMDLFDEDYPAAFVVFDRVVSSDASYQKKWLLHSIEEPSVEGNTTVIARTQDGFNGKLVNKTMLPEDFTIDKVGGKGQEGWVDGENYPYTDAQGVNSESGDWRIELSPASANTEDLFLNAMYVTDYDRNLPELPMYQEETSEFAGVTVKDRFVLFSKEGDVKDSTVSFTVRDNGYSEVSCMIADIAEGVWKVSGGGKDTYVEVKGDENVLYFKGAPGAYTVTPAPGMTAEEVVYPQAEKEGYGDFLVYAGGMFLYQKHPTKLIDGVAYLSAEGTEEVGGTVQYNGNTVTITGLGGSAVYTAGSNTYLLNGTEQIGQSAVVQDGNVLYIPVDSLRDVLYVLMDYDPIARILYLTTQELRKEFMDTYQVNVLMPTEITASDSDGNVPANASDWSLSTRWSSEGQGKWLMYDMGEEVTFSKVMIAYYRGAERQSYFDIQVSNDGVNWNTVYADGVSSGKTDQFESFDVGSVTARYIRYVGYENSLDTWNSVSEFVIAQ